MTNRQKAQIKLALINSAIRAMDKPQSINKEEGKILDRALRAGLFTDIDPFWVRWGYVAEQQGWLSNGS